MKCLNCGKDIGTSLGLCGTCRTHRSTRSAGHSYTPAQSSFASFVLSNVLHRPTLMACICLLPVALAVAWLNSGDEAITYSLNRNVITLKSEKDDSFVSYNLQGFQHIAIRMIGYQNQKQQISQLGIRGAGVLLSDQDYLALQKVRGCQAGFLNEHGIVLLIPASQVISEKMRSLAIQDGTRVELDGSYASVNEYRRDGKDYPREMFSIHNKIFLVRDITPRSNT